MVYKKNFQSKKLIKSVEQNENFTIIQSGLFKIGEDLTSQIDGVRSIFTVSNLYMPNTLKVYLDGIRLRRTIDYSELSDNQFQLTVIPIIGQDLVCDYIRKDI